MRICNISHCISSIDITSGGPSKSVSDLCVKLSGKAKVNLTTSISKQPYPIDENINLNLIFLPKRIFDMSFFQHTWKRDLSIFHGHGMWNLSIHWMSSHAYRNNIPYVLTPRGMLEPWAIKQGRWKKMLAWRLYQYRDLKNASCIHVTADMELKSVRNLGLKNPIALIPNGIDVCDFPQKVMSCTSLAKRKILFLSRIHHKKGIELLIDAWAMIPADIRQNWHIDVVGNGEQEYLNSLQIRIDNQGLQNQISIVGPKFGEDKIISYQSADIFVLPTYSENFGVVVAEALASGIPVITTKGAPWKSLVDHQCGWWIDIDAHALKDALLEAMALSDQERFEMGIRGRQLVQDEFSIDSVADKMYLLYQWILGEVEKPDFVYIN